jgi:hypothetical protein
LWNTQGIWARHIGDNVTFANVVRNGDLTLIELSTNNVDMNTGIDNLTQENFVIQGDTLIANFKELHSIRTYTIPQLVSLVTRTPWKTVDTETHMANGVLTHRLKAILTR